MTNQMCVQNTPVEHYPQWGLYVKREDLCCPSGPHFSKTRGVFARVASRPEKLIGVLDTSHSQGGWAVAQACKLLGKRCKLFYPVPKGQHNFPIQRRSPTEPQCVDIATHSGQRCLLAAVSNDRCVYHDLTLQVVGPNHVLRPQQAVAADLGAKLDALPASNSAVLYQVALNRLAREPSSYMMPNALKLGESVNETADEYARSPIPDVPAIVVSASSGTIAAGVVRGAMQAGFKGKIVIHLGYSRPIRAVRRYVMAASRVALTKQVELVDEGYTYADEATDGVKPPFPCNSYYDLKALRWWVGGGRETYGEALFWNIG